MGEVAGRAWFHQVVPFPIPLSNVALNSTAHAVEISHIVEEAQIWSIMVRNTACRWLTCEGLRSPNPRSNVETVGVIAIESAQVKGESREGGEELPHAAGMDGPVVGYKRR